MPAMWHERELSLPAFLLRSQAWESRPLEEEAAHNVSFAKLPPTAYSAYSAYSRDPCRGGARSPFLSPLFRSGVGGMCGPWVRPDATSSSELSTTYAVKPQRKAWLRRQTWGIVINNDQPILPSATSWDLCTNCIRLKGFPLVD